MIFTVLYYSLGIFIFKQLLLKLWNYLKKFLLKLLMLLFAKEVDRHLKKKLPPILYSYLVWHKKIKRKKKQKLRKKLLLKKKYKLKKKNIFMKTLGFFKKKKITEKKVKCRFTKKYLSTITLL